jgi:hypothetical protein
MAKVLAHARSSKIERPNDLPPVVTPEAPATVAANTAPTRVIARDNPPARPHTLDEIGASMYEVSEAERIEDERIQTEDKKAEEAKAAANAVPATTQPASPAAPAPTAPTRGLVSKDDDPYAELKDLLRKQKPESREKEIRIQKNRAKATAWLQAFGTLADAFTLHKGGDVVARDLNPVIYRNMDKADAIKEQARQEEKAWQNTWIGLQGKIADMEQRKKELATQHARQAEATKQQQEWHSEEAEKQREFAAKEKELERNDRIMSGDYEKETKKEFMSIQHGYEIEKIELNRASDLAVAYARRSTSESKGTGADKTMEDNTKVVLSVKNPNGSGETINLTDLEVRAIYEGMRGLKKPVLDSAGKDTGKTQPRYPLPEHKDMDAADKNSKALQLYADDPVAFMEILSKLRGTGSTSGTNLGQNEENEYLAWKNRLPKNLQNEHDYDLKGLWKENPSAEPSDKLHFPDKYKKPNHFTFSNESKYSNPSTEGGKWVEENGKWMFYASNFNLTQHSAKELQDYFDVYEKDAQLILPTTTRGNSGNSEQINEKIKEVENL